MDNNKPLLFIETVQTTINENVGQIFYDSRRAPKLEVVKKVEEVEQVDQASQEDPSLDTTLEKEKSSKLHQKANLLDKRARQNHFVYVEINLIEGGHYRGFFKGLSNNSVLLSEEEDVREIKLVEILDITILKV